MFYIFLEICTYLKSLYIVKSYYSIARYFCLFKKRIIKANKCI